MSRLKLSDEQNTILQMLLTLTEDQRNQIIEELKIIPTPTFGLFKNPTNTFFHEHPEFFTFSFMLYVLCEKSVVLPLTTKVLEQKYEHIYVTDNGCQFCQNKALAMLRSHLQYLKGWGEESLIFVKWSIRRIEDLSNKKYEPVVFPDFLKNIQDISSQDIEVKKAIFRKHIPHPLM